MRLLLLLLFITFMSACGTTSAIKEPAAAPVTTSTDDVSELKAKIDDLNNRIFVMTEQLDSMRASRNVSKGNTVEPTDKVEVIDDKDEYISAYNLFKDKEYAKAMVALSAFIDKYPNSILAGNASFWIGESYYRQKEYSLAISEYLKVIKKYSDGSKTPEAMLKISKSYRMLGEEKDADAYLRALISRYPNSRAASMADNTRS